MEKKKTLFVLLLIFVLNACCAEKYDIEKASKEVYSKASFDGHLPPNPFVSDGCSCWPDSEWVQCCIEHDLVYWMGGSRGKRKEADLELRQCVREKGFPVTAHMMYFGVRIGGVWWLPTNFRWGFGWEYPQSGPPHEPY